MMYVVDVENKRKSKSIRLSNLIDRCPNFDYLHSVSVSNNNSKRFTGSQLYKFIHSTHSAIYVDSIHNVCVFRSYYTYVAL